MSRSGAKDERYWSVVGPDGTITIPPELCDELGVTGGGLIDIDVVDGRMILRRHDPAAGDSPQA